MNLLKSCVKAEHPRYKHHGCFTFPDLSSLSAAATGAMTEELRTTPKPGLIDLRDNGSHSDMDFNTFIDSIEAIRPFFLEVTQRVKGQEISPELFNDLREIGIRAESAMFCATNGINTHKGQIFVMILLLSASSCSSPQYLPEIISLNVKNLVSDIVSRDLKVSGNCNKTPSHGEILFQKHGIMGVRGEAEKGFPIIFDVALPVFTSLISQGYSRNSASVETLLHIMNSLEDTTIIHRGGFESLERMHILSGRALEYGAMRTKKGRKYIQNLNRYFIEKGLSPGGCADILAGTLFIHSVLNLGHNT